MTTLGSADPHASTPTRRAGPAPQEAAATLVMIHGRGASAESILTLHRVIDQPNLAAIAPEAAGGTWYPQRFIAPIEANQPFLDSALRRLETEVSGLLAMGIDSRRIALLGFSQGACLISEFAARHPRPYGALLVLSGGLIGPPGMPRTYEGSLDGVRVFLGCGDPDAHIPFERVEETGDVLGRMGATVDMRRYPGIGHTIIQDEIEICRQLLKEVADGGLSRDF